MTILEVTATTFGPLRTGGGERHPTEFLRELSKHETVVASYALPATESPVFEPFVRVPARFGSLPTLLTPSNPLPWWGAARTISGYLRDHDGEVEFVHIHNLRTAVATLWTFLAYLRKKHDRIRILLTDHGARFFPAPQLSARWVDYWVPVSRLSELQLLALAPHPSRVVPAAVSDRFLDTPPRSFDERPLDLLFAGRIAPWKRPERVLDLAARLRARLGRPISTVLAGGVVDTAFVNFLHRHAESLDLGPEVEFRLGPTDGELLQLYSRAKVYCFPSDTIDTFGRRHPFPELSSATVLEAAALGTPTLANRIPAAEEQVQQGVTGYVVAGIDSVEGVERAATLLQEPTAWTSVSRAARAYVLAERTYPRIVDRFRGFLGEIRGGIV